MCSEISIVGRIGLCEWTGPTPVAVVVALLSALKRARQPEDASLLLILDLDAEAAASLTRSASPFLSALPAIWDCCEELVVSAVGGPVVAAQLRRAFCSSSTVPISCLAKPITFFESLDEAFAHALGIYPQDTIELQRQRVRSGSWIVKDVVNCR